MRLFLSLLLSLTPLAAQQHGSITGNPFTSPEDRDAGAQSFKSQCAACHGLDGSDAAAGPDLSTGAFKHGGTDEALFRTIPQGVAGEPMVGVNLNIPQGWQLLTFLRFLRHGQYA